MTGDDANLQRRPTIYDLAQLASSSPSAVSSILNGTWKKRRISAATAERVTRIAAEQGYAVNRQASMLRTDRSHVLGMIVPKYDNRYFGAIVEQFEEKARARGLFPVLTCTQRDPRLEFEAARELLSYQAECLVVTGATDPHRIAGLCRAAGVRVVNLDLPGSQAPSIISDNFGGALDLAGLVLDHIARDFGAAAGPLWFVGGRKGDHNTAERLRGFRAAHEKAGLAVDETRILIPGYASTKVAAVLSQADPAAPLGMFVNSTIALEGVLRALTGPMSQDEIRIGCFDWDPIAALLPQIVAMVQQDVGAMLERLFDVIDDAIDSAESSAALPPVACILRVPKGEAVPVVQIG